MPHIGHTIPSSGGATLPIAESDVTNLTTDLAAKASALVASQSISGTATLVDGSAKMVLTDTTSAAFTLTLPAAPSSGSVFIILDSLGTWNTNNLTVARNGKLIDGVASNATHVTQYGIVEYLYDGTGWRSKIRQLSQANPVIDGTAAPGTSLKVSREDHVHPTDTSRAPLASPTFTGTVTLPEGNDAAAGTASRRTLGTGATQAAQGSLAAPLASPTFTGTPAAPTASAGTNTTQLATTAYADRVTSGSYRLGLNSYANFNPALSIAAAGQQNANDARYVTIVIDQTGNLRDINFYITTANAGNSKIFVLDTGQANATHTTRTCLAISGSLSGASTGYMAYDPNLAVTKGDTLHLCITNPDTTIKWAQGTGTIIAAGLTALPASFIPSSGAGTAAQKLSGNILAANVPTAVNNTVTDANMANAPTSCPWVGWRIS